MIERPRSGRHASSALCDSLDLCAARMQSVCHRLCAAGVACCADRDVRGRGAELAEATVVDVRSEALAAQRCPMQPNVTGRPRLCVAFLQPHCPRPTAAAGPV